MTRFTRCADEIFMQVMAYNSPYKDNINYIDDEEHSSSMWYSTWIYEDNGKARPKHNFILEDYEDIMNSGGNFARKFAGEDGVVLINLIKKYIENKK